MQKRNLVILGLSLISILLISGCQQAVGGKFNPNGIGSNIGSLTYASSGDTLNIELRDATKLMGNGYCFNGAAGLGFSVGNIIKLKTYDGTDICYVLLGCSAVGMEGKISGQNYRNDAPYNMAGTTINPSNPGPIGWYAQPLILFARPIMSTGEQIQCNQGPNVPVTAQELVDANTFLVSGDLVRR